jgi:hypothetical protein
MAEEKRLKARMELQRRVEDETRIRKERSDAVSRMEAQEMELISNL